MSIPVDVSEDAEYAKLEEKGVKGRYVSVERIQELDNGTVEWRMATSSTPGGSIPQFVAESSMASTISHVSILYDHAMEPADMTLRRMSPISLRGCTRIAPRSPLRPLKRLTFMPPSRKREQPRMLLWRKRRDLALLVQLRKQLPVPLAAYTLYKY